MIKLKKLLACAVIGVFTVVSVPVMNVYAEETQETGNDYPYVFVHGFMGYGGNEVQHEYYWGGKVSIMDMLSAEGYKVYSPSIDALGSNYDRACELYAYLKGGRVDYGKVHAEKTGHARFGKTYPGVMKDLGEADENGKVKKVHLLGHSMGGETIRVLASLLEEGSPEEVAATGSETSPLFTGDKHWVDSVTTLSTPHDGSQIAEISDTIKPANDNFFVFLAAISGSNDIKLDMLYPSLGLEQWGLKKQPGENDVNYYNRVFKSSIWKSTNDTGLHDLTLEGARELNAKYKAEDDIYYFSVAACGTHKDIFGHQVPDKTMGAMFTVSGTILGNYVQSGNNKVVVDNQWWKNDGLVSVRSSMGPHEGSVDKIAPYNGSAVRGQWNYLGEIDGIDHLELARQDNNVATELLRGKYQDWVKMLSMLD